MSGIAKIKEAKNGTIFKRGDIAVYICLVFLIASFFLAFVPTEPGSTVIIKFKAEPIKSVSIFVDADFTILIDRSGNLIAIEDGDKSEETKLWNMTCPPAEIRKFSLIVVQDGKVWVAAADCRDHLCMHDGVKDKAGSVITCLPLAITIVVM